MIYLVDLPSEILMHILSFPHMIALEHVLTFCSVDKERRQQVLEALSRYFQSLDHMRLYNMPLPLAIALNDFRSTILSQKRTRNIWQKMAPLISLLGPTFIGLWIDLRKYNQKIVEEIEAASWNMKIFIKMSKKNTRDILFCYTLIDKTLCEAQRYFEKDILQHSRSVAFFYLVEMSMCTKRQMRLLQALGISVQLPAFQEPAFQESYNIKTLMYLEAFCEKNFKKARPGISEKARIPTISELREVFNFGEIHFTEDNVEIVGTTIQEI